MINLPIIIGGILFVLLAVFLIFFMKETNFTPASAEDRNSWAQMRPTFIQGIKFIRGESPLILMVGIS